MQSIPSSPNTSSPFHLNPFRDLLSFLLPRTCAACNVVLKDWEECLCLTCRQGLPVTMFHLDPGNPLAEGFWGRVWLEQAVAWFYFRKGSIYQEVLHRMKYNYRPDIGIFLGKEFGYELNRSPMFIKPDLIIPVPLHKRKQRLRGYNQSELIAKGLSLAMKLPIETRALQKSQSTSTQTRKSRFDRWINVSGMFEVVMPELIAGRHVLLVDDVVTTGATLEACAEVLLKVGGVKVSVAAIAWAND